MSLVPLQPTAGVLDPDLRFWIGLGLASGSTLLIGASFLVTKKSFTRMQEDEDGSLQDPSGNNGFLSNWLWWLGLILMALGESANFFAYALVPAVLVTPLGALTFLWISILAPVFFGDRMNLLGWLSGLLCLVGSTLIVMHSPKEIGMESINEMGELLAQPAFVAYLLVVIVGSIILTFYFAPRFGRSNVFVYVLICSLIGSLSVMAVKGLGLAVMVTWSGVSNEFSNGLTYIFIANILVCLAIQLIYLNRALDLFSASVVCPLYYIFFTTFVMIATGILYQEFANISWYNLVGLALGYSINVISITMLLLFRNVAHDYEKFKAIMKPEERAIKANWSQVGPISSHTPLITPKSGSVGSRNSDRMDGDFFGTHEKSHLLEHAASFAGTDRQSDGNRGSLSNGSKPKSPRTSTTSLGDDEEDTIVVHLGDHFDELTPEHESVDNLEILSSEDQVQSGQSNDWRQSSASLGVARSISKPGSRRSTVYGSPRSTVYGSVASLSNV
eukprot:maker-scaffold330_size203968-snap-gene-0.24 protein:Tk05064 transcript:maker-scaffold330_size203968-snap-gene-0.24-mRNA-1 annotation:"magnesium transporter nipa2-like isoform x1"